MVKTFATDKNGDFTIGSNGSLKLLDGLAAVLDACASAAKVQLGEMMFAVDKGLPNFQVVWKGAPNIPQYEAALLTTLKNVAGVFAVENLEITISGKQLNYTAVIVTEFGTGTLNG